MPPEHSEVIIVGGGQAGLAVGYHLARRKIPFLILDARPNIGDAWRERWDSLRLFTPARFDGLDGMPFPAGARTFPTKDAMADYLAAYARRFAIPVRNGVKVESLSRRDGCYRLVAGDQVFEAGQVVIAMSNFQAPVRPDFAATLAPEVRQMHSAEYRNPAQLKDGPVLLVGAGNSGAEIALDLVTSRKVWLAGRDVGEAPFDVESFWGHLRLCFLLRVMFHRLLTMATPMGRRASAVQRPTPLIRARLSKLAAAGVEILPKVAQAEGAGLVLADGRALHPANVIWCTGFRPDFSWIELPLFDADGRPRHNRGVAENAPGVYFVGLHFLYALSSTMVHGVSRDARFVADAICRKAASGRVARLR